MSKRPGYSSKWCIHFRSMGRYETCEAGVPYSKFDGIVWAKRPCFTDPGEKAPCEHCRLPTAEEIKAHDEWKKGRTDALYVVLTGIMPWREAHKGKSVQEVVKCPACGGKLHLSISSYNGHIHGWCETEGCVSWME